MDFANFANLTVHIQDMFSMKQHTGTTATAAVIVGGAFLTEFSVVP